jgi:hypothetical protein
MVPWSRLPTATSCRASSSHPLASHMIGGVHPDAVTDSGCHGGSSQEPIALLASGQALARSDTPADPTSTDVSGPVETQAQTSALFCKIAVQVPGCQRSNRAGLDDRLAQGDRSSTHARSATARSPTKIMGTRPARKSGEPERPTLQRSACHRDGVGTLWAQRDQRASTSVGSDHRKSPWEH